MAGHGRVLQVSTTCWCLQDDDVECRVAGAVDLPSVSGAAAVSMPFVPL